MKRIIIAIMLIGLPFMVFGQDYYTGKNAVTIDGVTYVITKNREVQNSKNTLYGKPELMSDGTIFYSKDWDFYVRCKNKDIVDQIVKENIPQPILSRMKMGDCHLMINVVVIPLTGRVVEVCFILTNFGRNKVNEACAIPPKSLMAIEKELKEKLRYECSMTNIDHLDGFLYSSGSRGHCTSNVK